MSTTYIWRPSGGYYFSSSGSSASAANHFYYSSNRTFRMDFNAPGLDKSTISIKSAILRVYISTANSATLTIGYRLLMQIVRLCWPASPVYPWAPRPVQRPSTSPASCRRIAGMGKPGNSTCGAMEQAEALPTPTSEAIALTPATVPSAHTSHWCMIPARPGSSRTARGKRQCLMSTTTASGNRHR